MNSARYKLGLVVLVLFFSASAFAGELNLWVSYYFSGESNRASGEYADASMLLADARGELHKTRVEPHRVVLTLTAQGMTKMASDDYEGAEQCLLKALRKAEQALGRKSRWLPAVLNSLGDLYYVTGAPEKSETYYRRALYLTERDQTNLEVCRALNGLALIKNDCGSPVESEELLKRAITIHEKNLRGLHPYCATAYTNLGILYTNLGKYDQAKEALDCAAYIQNKSLGAVHPDVALRLEAQAALDAKTGKPQDAAALQKQAEAIRKHFQEINQSKTS